MSAGNDWANGGGCFDKSASLLIVLVVALCASVGWASKRGGRAAVKRRG